MKKGLFLLASVAILMLAGCGESGAATSSNPSTGSKTSNVVIDDKIVDTTVAGDVKDTIETKLGAIPDFSRK
jgi:ABC-type Zn uptake system ZnuABC Zn-binding protein ZnuA